MQQSQIDIMQSSNEITYDLQEGGECSVRSTLCSHQTRSRTPWRREENAASYRHSAVIKRDHVRSGGGESVRQSDRHSAIIKRDHVRSAGGGRMQQSDRHSVVIKRDHVRTTGGGRMQQSDRHSVVIKRDHVRSVGGGRMQQSDRHSETSKEITYFLQEERECGRVRSTFCSH
jgi:hypothetical protein